MSEKEQNTGVLDQEVLDQKVQGVQTKQGPTKEGQENPGFELLGITTIDWSPTLIYVKPGFNLTPSTDLVKNSDNIRLKKLTLTELVDMLGPKDVQQMYPQFFVIKDKQCIGNAKQGDFIQIDLEADFPILQKLYPDHDGLRSMKRKMRGYQKQPAVPPEYKDKYCLLFGGKVVYSGDSKEDLIRERAKCPYLDYTEYIPNLAKQ